MSPARSSRYAQQLAGTGVLGCSLHTRKAIEGQRSMTMHYDDELSSDTCPTALVVDDNDVVRPILCEMLQFLGFQTTDVGDAVFIWGRKPAT